MKRSSAFTLVEVLMTMTMGSTLMLLAIGLVHQSLSLSKLGKTRSEHDRSVNRVAQQFRADVHSASVVIAASADSLQLAMPDSTIVSYLAVESAVERKQTALTGPPSYDRFQFEPLCRIQFLASAKSPLAQFQLQRSFPHQELPTRVDVQVIAQVARWQQLENSVPTEQLGSTESSTTDQSTATDPPKTGAQP